MSEAVTAFDALCCDAAERFVQTAIVVDNEASLGPPQGEAPASRIAKKRGRPKTGRSDSGAEESGSTEATTGAPITGEIDTSHYLDMKALGDTFLKQKIVCGVYRPDENEKMIEPTIAAASTADIVIIDWQLQGPKKGSARAKEIVAELLKRDANTGPRLRLVAIYTGQKELRGLAAELFEHIREIAELETFRPCDADPTVLLGPHARLIFVNKERTLGAIKGDRVASESNLPGLLLKEYARLARGILPATAMAAIADIRKATPHILTVFHKGLDGAYVGHRAMIPTAEDAEPFLRRIITEELDTVIETAGTASRFAGKSAVEKWLFDLSESGHEFKKGASSAASIAAIKGVLDLASEDPSDYITPAVAIMKNVFGAKGVKQIFRNFGQLFYSEGADRAALLEFSRLCDLKRENCTRSRFSENWVPVLSLGSVVRPLFDGKGKGPGGVAPNQLLLCVQPRCDSVRIPSAEGRKFPFLLISPKEDRFQFVVRSGEEDITYVGPSVMYNTVLFEFSPLNNDEPFVISQKKGVDFVFTDNSNNKFEWIADMKDLQAQNIAGNLGARAASVGYDEHEWLRWRMKS